MAANFRCPIPGNACRSDGLPQPFFPRFRPLVLQESGKTKSSHSLKMPIYFGKFVIVGVPR